MTPKCPHCGSIIYSRRHALCGVCGQQLPPELLFTPKERKIVERQLEPTEYQKRHAEEEKKEMREIEEFERAITRKREQVLAHLLIDRVIVVVVVFASPLMAIYVWFTRHSFVVAIAVGLFLMLCSVLLWTLRAKRAR
jgi:NMD protein affecting ribosome stability and mRNA decay